MRNPFEPQHFIDHEPDHWEHRALCGQIDPELFFPDQGGDVGRTAKKQCRKCDVRLQCLNAALANDERGGIWGGLSEPERDQLVRERGAA